MKKRLVIFFLDMLIYKGMIIGSRKAADLEESV